MQRRKMCLRLEAWVSKVLRQFLSYSCLLHMTCKISFFLLIPKYHLICVACCELQGFSSNFPSNNTPIHYSLVGLEKH